ncbi:MAG: WD40/YVTN/BNR-like repeat-containing protein, partial [Gemmatimonadaceae bacterium]
MPRFPIIALLLPALLPAPLRAQGEPAMRRAAADQPRGAGDSSAVVLARGLRARGIGPAVMGGRVSDIALDPRTPSTFYVGLGTGGVMKTTDGGASFSAVFERQPVASVGAVAVAPSDPSVVWVGSGEPNDRNSSSWGNGVYRSTDGGGTWTNVGLKASRTIARIVVHPTDPKTAYVAAMGDLWGWSAERGCYRTTDAGATWARVLSAPAPLSDRVGCGDIAIDPSNPSVVYAALYARRRLPWAFEYGPGATEGRDAGGIYKSTDGGATWKKLAGGLPVQTGRIGLAVYAKNPRVVYAVVQSDEGGTQNIDMVRSRRGGVFRSDDGGETWTRQSALDPRPFYFSQIRVDPANDQKVYVLGYALHVSEDGGKSWREDRFKNVHPDNHALAIDPRQPERLLLGNDGGAYQSFNAGESWAHLSTFAGGEFYRINVDMGTPYRVCGGLQDNLNWVGPSRTRTKDGIVNSDWINIEGGDGFYCVFDPDSSNIVYAESQSGYVHRMNLATGEVRNLRPEPTEGQAAFRFHWNSPLIGSRHTRGALYLGGNRVFKLTDRGEHWRTISPDLTTQNVQRILATGSGAETYGVVYALAESPAKAGMLWAGTDDGKLWVTEDDGANWTDLTASLPAAVKGQWISRVEPSSKDARV